MKPWNLAQMNPPIRDESHQVGIWKGVKDRVIDVIGSDHAPHTIEEKKKISKITIRYDGCSNTVTNNVKFC